MLVGNPGTPTPPHPNPARWGTGGCRERGCILTARLGGDASLEDVEGGTRPAGHAGHNSAGRGTRCWRGHTALTMGGDPSREGDMQPWAPGVAPRRGCTAPNKHGVPGSGVPPGLSSPSRDMPTSRHFLKRHCWQRLRLMRTMEQFSFLRHFLYWMFCWMLRRKKPCGAGGGCHSGPPPARQGLCATPAPAPVPCSPRRRGHRSGSRRQHPRRPCRAAPSRSALQRDGGERGPRVPTMTWG